MFTAFYRCVWCVAKVKRINTALFAWPARIKMETIAPHSLGIPVLEYMLETCSQLISRAGRTSAKTYTRDPCCKSRARQNILGMENKTKFERTKMVFETLCPCAMGTRSHFVSTDSLPTLRHFDPFSAATCLSVYTSKKI